MGGHDDGGNAPRVSGSLAGKPRKRGEGRDPGSPPDPTGRPPGGRNTGAEGLTPGSSSSQPLVDPPGRVPSWPVPVPRRPVSPRGRLPARRRAATWTTSSASWGGFHQAGSTRTCWAVGLPPHRTRPSAPVPPDPSHRAHPRATRPPLGAFSPGSRSPPPARWCGPDSGTPPARPPPRPALPPPRRQALTRAAGPVSPRAAFRAFRPVSAEVMADKFTGKSRCFGFVRFETAEDKDDAIRARHRTVEVTAAAMLHAPLPAPCPPAVPRAPGPRPAVPV